MKIKLAYYAVKSFTYLSTFNKMNMYILHSYVKSKIHKINLINKSLFAFILRAQYYYMR